MPATISAWCLILFFLWYGLAAFVPASIQICSRKSAQSWRSLLSYLVSSECNRSKLVIQPPARESGLFTQRRIKMRMPSSIATWCLILFFLFYGLSAFGLTIPGIIMGLLALGVAIFSLLGR